ncbi:MAG: bacteriophage Gp15 family protein [Oscillospiraceae bacterium]|nr:bacteriophage Gp15 family protein [Oscillospiraceae bacterium]
MFRLGIQTQEPIPFNKNTYTANPTFKNVIKSSLLLKDPAISEAARINTALFLLLKRFSFYRANRLKQPEKIALLDKIFEALNPKGNCEKASGERVLQVLSLEKDAGLIYGGFLQAYGINLHKDELQWSEFCALISALPEGTAIYNVMKIRAMEIPANLSAEDAEKIYALKRTYSLDNDVSTPENYQKQLEKLFEKLAS